MGSYRNYISIVFIIISLSLQAQQPVNVSQPYNFLKWIKSKDSIQSALYRQGTDTLSTKAYVRSLVSAATPDSSRYKTTYSFKIDTVKTNNTGTVTKTMFNNWNNKRDSNIYAGAITEASFTDNGNGTATVGNCKVVLYPNALYTGIPRVYTVTGGTFTFTDLAEEYVCAKYNSGSPVIYKETDKTQINGSNVILLFICWRQGSSLVHSICFDSYGNGLSERINERLRNTENYSRTSDGGLQLSETSTPNYRTILVTSSTVYAGSVTQNVLSFNSSSDLMTQATVASGVWTFTDVLVYNNTDYNPPAGTSTLNNSKYGTRWFYRSIGDVKQVFYVMGGSEYNSQAAAELETEPTLPILIKNHCMLIGRIIIQKSANSGYVQSAFDNRFAGTSITAHSDLTNLDYASAGHTGFEPTVTKGNVTASSGITGSGTLTGAVIGAGFTLKADTTLLATQYYTKQRITDSLTARFPSNNYTLTNNTTGGNITIATNGIGSHYRYMYTITRSGNYRAGWFDVSAYSPAIIFYDKGAFVRSATDLGVTINNFNLNGNDIRLNYTTTNTGANATIKIKQLSKE